jgi:hypothetical protein
VKILDKILLANLMSVMVIGGAFAADAPARARSAARGPAAANTVAATAPAAGGSPRAVLGGTPVTPTRASTARNTLTPAVQAPVAEPEAVFVEPERATESPEVDNSFVESMDSLVGGDNNVDARTAARLRIAERDKADASESEFLRGVANASRSKCETELNTCVIGDCGSDLQKCNDDTDAIWSARFQKCRAKTSCTGAEIGVYGDIIKEDIRVDAKISLMNLIISCNNEYSNCLQTQCATTDARSLIGGGAVVGFNGCVTQAKINSALNYCKPVYDRCRPYDSGIQARFTNMMATLRVEKEKRIAELQKELDVMLPQMRQLCRDSGASFDERSGNCVFTAFLSVEAQGRRYTPASKMVMPGSQYQCTDQWFGVDVTQYLQNAIYSTIQQKSSVAALMGAGLGIGASVGLDMLKNGLPGEKLDKAAGMLEGVKDAMEEQKQDAPAPASTESEECDCDCKAKNALPGEGKVVRFNACITNAKEMVEEGATCATGETVSASKKIDDCGVYVRLVSASQPELPTPALTEQTVAAPEIVTYKLIDSDFEGGFFEVGKSDINEHARWMNECKDENNNVMGYEIKFLTCQRGKLSAKIKAAEAAGYKDWKINVEGYADDTGTDKTNDKLSEDRARKIKEELGQQLFATGSELQRAGETMQKRMKHEGKGSNAAKAAVAKAGKLSRKDLEELRKQFRRVDITFIPGNPPSSKPEILVDAIGQQSDERPS